MCIRDSIRTITQIGTGNYNEKTARLYTDLSIITPDLSIGEDEMCIRDSYYALSRWPDLGEQILCRPMGDYVGGMISNASSTLAGYGRHTYLIGTTTHSPEGDFILKTLGEAGVDLSHHNYDDNYTICLLYTSRCV